VSSFDQYFGEFRTWVSVLEAAHETARYCRPGDAAAQSEGLKVKVGPGANPGIILRGDTFVELGNPTAGSVAVVLWTGDTSLVQDGCVTVIGPDIPESEGESLPFAQVLLVGGPTLSPADHGALQQAHHIGDEIEGYMLRSTSEYLWSRVSVQAAAKGFDFETLGRANLYLVKVAQPRVTEAEIVFVTAGKAEVQSLTPLAKRSSDTGSELVHEVWREQGYDADCSLDCNACDSKPVCDEVRDLLATRLETQRAERVAEPTVASRAR